jgi:hypothetical protein
VRKLTLEAAMVPGMPGRAAREPEHARARACARAKYAKPQPIGCCARSSAIPNAVSEKWWSDSTSVFVAGAMRSSKNQRDRAARVRWLQFDRRHRDESSTVCIR